MQTMHKGQRTALRVALAAAVAVGATVSVLGSGPAPSHAAVLAQRGGNGGNDHGERPGAASGHGRACGTLGATDRPARHDTQTGGAPNDT